MASAPVAAFQTLGDRPPSTAPQIPVLDSAPRRPKVDGDGSGPARLGRPLALGVTLRPQERARPRDGLLGDSAGKALGEVIERVDHHVGIARSAQAPGAVTKHASLVPALARAERGPGEPEQRPLLLERLAGIVNRRHGIGLDPVRQLLRRAVELFARAPANTVAHRFAVSES